MRLLERTILFVKHFGKDLSQNTIYPISGQCPNFYALENT